MKYEMIFGDYKFSNETAEFAVTNIGGDILEMTSPITVPYGWAIIAMRRIIKEPKRWTWEDKKAGVLPEVGANVIGKRAVLYYEVALVTEKEIILKCCSGLCHTYKHNVFIEFFYPIETPAEKAQREEDEFVGNVSMFVDICTVSEEIKKAYKDGARAAYRKMKGGER